MAAMLRKFRGAGLLGTHGVWTRTDNWPYDKKTALCVSRLLAVVISWDRGVELRHPTQDPFHTSDRRPSRAGWSLARGT